MVLEDHNGSVNPNDFLGWTVVRLGHALALRFESVLAEHSLTATQFGVLAHLVRDPGLGSAQLARLVLVTPQSMGTLLDELAAAGLVERGPAVSGRRRETIVTSSGRQRLAAALPDVRRFETETTQRLNRQQQAEVNSALHQILDDVR